MAVAFRAIAGLTAFSGSSGTMTIPAGAFVGDVLVMIVGVNSQNGPPTAPGWTSRASQVNPSPGNAAVFLLTKTCGVGDPGSTFTLTLTLAATGTAFVSSYSGVDPNTPVGASTGSGTTSTSISSGSLTLSAASNYLVAATNADGGGALVTPPTGWTSRFTTTNSPATYLFDRTYGAVTTETVTTVVTTVSVNAGLLAVLNPSSGGSVMIV